MPCPLNIVDRPLCGSNKMEVGPYSRNKMFKSGDVDNSCLINKQSKSLETAVQIPAMSYRDGFGAIGPKGQCVDKDSMFRNGSVLTQHGQKILLPNPGYLTVPYMGWGRNNSCTSNVVIEGVGVSAKKSCFPETHRTAFMPLVGCLAEQVQNSEHIIQEDVKKDWVRGGYPSRRCVQEKNRKYECRYGKKSGM